jgi:hypothetical protein
MGLDIIEPLLTIIAQSIPILRVLVLDRTTGYENSEHDTILENGSPSCVPKSKSKAGRYTSFLGSKSRLSHPKLDTKPTGFDDTWEQTPSPSSQNFRRRSVVALYELEPPVRPYPAVSSMLDMQLGKLKEEWAS